MQLNNSSKKQNFFRIDCETKTCYLLKIDKGTHLKGFPGQAHKYWILPLAHPPPASSSVYCWLCFISSLHLLSIMIPLFCLNFSFFETCTTKIVSWYLGLLAPAEYFRDASSSVCNIFHWSDTSNIETITKTSCRQKCINSGN